MEQEKIKELNTLALYLVKELMKQNFEGFEQISFNDHTSENPSLGYSLGFSSRDLQTTITLYLYSGDTFPLSSEALKRHHLSGVGDVLTANPDIDLQDGGAKIEYFLGTEDMFGYLRTSLQDEHVLISTFFFGLLIKVRATSEKGVGNSQEIFLKQLYQNLSDIFLKFNPNNPTDSIEFHQ
jgi:hypothetical protein